MSHFTNIKTKLKDKDFLIKALHTIGYTGTENVLLDNPSNHQHEQVQVEIGVTKYDTTLEVMRPMTAGFKINDDGVLTNTSGYLDVNKFLLSSKKYFDNLRRYKSENFDKTKLKIKKNYFSYKNEEFKYVIMCTGISEKKINLFKDIKLNGVSGNSIIVKSKIGNDSIINKGINILPIKKNVYHIGSTYYHNMKDEGPDELVSKTKNLIKEDISLIDSKFGIRSTSKDRRPIIGEHNKIKKLFIMNAMGSKGVSQAPYCSKKLFNYINEDKNIDKEINIDRYRS